MKALKADQRVLYDSLPDGWFLMPAALWERVRTLQAKGWVERRELRRDDSRRASGSKHEYLKVDPE